MVKKIMIIAGEASGDLHGGKLAQALKEEPGVELFGVGGEQMAPHMELLYHVQDLAYVGFTEILKHLPFFIKVYRDLVRAAVQRNPAVVVLIDYPGLNLRLGKKLKAMGFTVFYFIAPQVWAWHQGRARKMASFIDRMAVIFDFEVKFFRAFGIDAHFVGHPLADGLEVHLSREAFCQRFGLSPAKPILALLPGSRQQEIDNLLPAMLRAVQHLRNVHQIEVAIAQADTIPRDLIERHAGQSVTIVKGATYELLSYATAGIITSGTATLEAACFQLPFVLLYRVSSLSYFLGKRMIKIPHIGLVNIIGQDEIAKEFIQDAIRPEVMASELEKCLFDARYRQEKMARMAEVKSRLGESGAAARTARLILEMISSGDK
ncbi:lipid-A-disaccharide synthase [candidate division KSB1 bacterium]|nr:lipid-A-disaccharide synthase [candidate division KSB1 bacterium]RQW09265.1 MAG: lipid-A-disaccharide synthase [candidate division KSB1 bacterium]